MGSETLHAPRERLSRRTLALHHAIVSLIEELDAVDWYRQRADDCEDDALRDILLHNMREEMEHACMVLEWMRRNNAEFAANLDTYLYSEAPIVDVEKNGRADPGGEDDAPQAPPSPSARPAGFTVGPLK